MLLMLRNFFLGLYITKEKNQFCYCSIKKNKKYCKLTCKKDLPELLAVEEYQHFKGLTITEQKDKLQN